MYDSNKAVDYVLEYRMIAYVNFIDTFCALRPSITLQLRPWLFVDVLGLYAVNEQCSMGMWSQILLT